MLKQETAEIWARRVFMLRIKLGLTQEQFGETVGKATPKSAPISRQSVRNWEKGVYLPEPDARKVIEGLVAEHGSNGLSMVS